MTTLREAMIYRYSKMIELGYEPVAWVINRYGLDELAQDPEYTSVYKHLPVEEYPFFGIPFEVMEGHEQTWCFSLRISGRKKTDGRTEG